MEWLGDEGLLFYFVFGFCYCCKGYDVVDVFWSKVFLEEFGVVW